MSARRDSELIAASDRQVEAVLALRERSREALLERRFDERALLYSSTYAAHTPDYTIVDAQGLTRALTSGRVSYDSSESSIEYARSHGPGVVVVMGLETVVPSAGRPNAGRQVPRRFTDLYRIEGGKWRHDIRHAHLAQPEHAQGVAPPALPPIRISSDARVNAVLDYRQATFNAVKAGTASDPSGTYSSSFAANTPMGTILTGPEMQALFAKNTVTYAAIAQSVEYAAPHGDFLVVIMGGEIVVPGPGIANAGRNIHRRFTDVFRYEDGAWRHDLRHANAIRID